MVVNTTVVIVVALLTIAVIEVLRPHDDNTQVIITIMGFLAALVKLDNIHNQVNSKMTLLIEKTDEAARLSERAAMHAEGLAEKLGTAALVQSTDQAARVSERAAIREERIEDKK